VEDAELERVQQEDIQENIEELAEVEGGGEYLLNEDLEEELFEEQDNEDEE